MDEPGAQSIRKKATSKGLHQGGDSSYCLPMYQSSCGLPANIGAFCWINPGWNWSEKRHWKDYGHLLQSTANLVLNRVRTGTAFTTERNNGISHHLAHTLESRGARGAQRSLVFVLPSLQVWREPLGRQRGLCELGKKGLHSESHKITDYIYSFQ